MYRMSARARGLRVIEVPLDDSWDLAVASLTRALDVTPPNVVFIASPNNPTGRLASRDRLIELIEAARGALVVIDEAYVDYAARNQLDLCRAYDNVAILRTLSKVGFAALRVGWLIASPALVAELDKTRLPYNVPAPCQRLATLVLSELAQEVENTTREVCAERERLAKEIAAIDGVDVAPSDANFLWIRTRRPASDVWSGLAERGVLVRSFHSRGGRLLHQLRVTIGTRVENETVLKALREVI
jgi:histidinol-phosphate aminotransferase